MVTIFLNHHKMGEFSRMQIKNNQLVLRNAHIQSYGLISWIQSTIETDVDVIGDRDMIFTNAKIIDYISDNKTIKKVTLAFDNILSISG